MCLNLEGQVTNMPYSGIVYKINRVLSHYQAFEVANIWLGINFLALVDIRALSC